jgi:hypothetical protein
VRERDVVRRGARGIAGNKDKYGEIPLEERMHCHRNSVQNVKDLLSVNVRILGKMIETGTNSISLDGFGLGEIEASSTQFTTLIFWRFDLASASAETKYVQLIHPVKENDYWEIKIGFEDGNLLYRAKQLSISTIQTTASVDTAS